MGEITLPADIKQILGALAAGGYEAYVVGGCVRDSVLGVEPKDWDITTSATPREVIDCFAHLRVVETGLKHGTVTLVKNGAAYEITTFRTEGAYSDRRRPDSVEFVSDVRLDLARRDFTINAMAYNDDTGLVDPFHGVDDLRRGVVSCVGEARERFGEDALRIMRALRFASVCDFAIAPETAEAIGECAPLLDAIARERIFRELVLMLAGDGVCRVLTGHPDVMTRIIPELSGDRYAHAARAVEKYRGGDSAVSLALLLGASGEAIADGEREALAGSARAILRRLKSDRRTRDEVGELVRLGGAALSPDRREVGRRLRELGEARFFRLTDFIIADVLAAPDGEKSERLTRCERARETARRLIDAGGCFSLDRLAINGGDLIALGVPATAQIGALLDSALSAVVDGELENERGALLRFVCEAIARE